MLCVEILHLFYRATWRANEGQEQLPKPWESRHSRWESPEVVLKCCQSNMILSWSCVFLVWNKKNMRCERKSGFKGIVALRVESGGFLWCRKLSTKIVSGQSLEKSFGFYLSNWRMMPWFVMIMIYLSLQWLPKKTWVEHNHDPMKLNSIYLFVLKTQIPFWAGDGPFSF